MNNRIAVIDDSLTIRNIAKKYINAGGFEAFCIEDIKNYLSVLKKIKPALILLDIYLGEEDIDGHSICKTIRNDETLSDIPVIMMSSLNEKIDIKKAFDSGSNIFIHKPFSQKEIIKEIRNLLIKDKRDEKILLVDDSSVLRKIVKFELERGGFSIIEAGSGKEGIEVLKKEKIDLIILDIEMEGMDGFEFAKLTKGDISFYTIPIIMLSSLDDPLIIKKAFKSGIVEYFIKPFKHGALLKFVKEVIIPANIKKEQQKKIIIIDDSQAQRSVLNHILKRDGKEVLSFENPKKALDYIEDNEDISLIITDIYMPEMDGLEFSKKAKKIREDIPIIGISATRSKESVLNALSSGMDDFLYIPFYEEELNLRVNLQIKLYQKIKELNGLNKILKEQSFKDPLTSLYNRRAVFDLLEAEFERTIRNDSELSIVMFDIDYFKQVNDTYGHPKGDEVLKYIAATLKGNIRSYDIAARIGGEEFLLLLPHTDKKTAWTIAERVRKVIKNGDISGIKITISGGISTIKELKETEKISDFIKKADERLYKAKKSGRDKIVFS